jgi:GNAT superfamily N-acetyltransferase
VFPKKSAPTTTAIEVLVWDSQFFGRRIGRVNTSQPTDQGLAAAVVAGRHADLDCVYLTLVPADTLPPIPESFGFHLVDVQLDLERQLQPVQTPSEPSGFEVRRGLLTDIPMLGPVIEALAPWSRFAMDPRFGVKAAKRMYEAWIEKCAASDHSMFVVATKKSEPVGFITVELVTTADIGLLGTSEAGAGIGSLLIKSAVDWATHHGQTLSVTTQARNVAALRFYGRHGFEIKRASYVYHLWLK